ncbi:uncharacterized protein BDW43DRAFT_302073 [Aspergillus alliaceus]|uniref:uncharacterized protein n=1 Tax=Petromyces alliaceus TaxID=209559 RepID=UPI0012A440AF|nr:uncharacterized protein BDW43DRAFT_302073 [Aspergillus alliaceus]KAB8230977.1 hypothetical protein BDW43DRAFT_302073 [Aspergillus alliaceus]
MSGDRDLGATEECPSLPWRILSSTTIFGVAALCRSFLYACSRPEVNGLDSFLELLDSRQDPAQRKKGLLTGIALMDDPIMWGFLPLRYNFGLSNWNKRWGFGSHDICFQGRPLSLFFTMGQVLPTHRLAHSPYGGVAQPAVTQAIRLLSKGPFSVDAHVARPERQYWSRQNVCVDPFSDLPMAYTTNGEDSHLAPSAFACNSYSWVHIFPEGKIHQAPNKTMRYFKWGVARLILETSECPDVVPMWVEGFDQVMHESREFPRFLPRPRKDVSVTFGQKVDTEAVFGGMRQRWRELKAKAELTAPETRDLPVGVLSDELLYGKEAVELRKEVTKKVRDLVLDVRRSRGLPDEDPKEGLVETWLQEGPKREGKMQDDSWHHKSTFAKPASTAHHTLASSGLRDRQNDRSRSQVSSSAEQPSVNDLINHLRRTQVSHAPSEDGPRISFRVAPRSVHPSLRNLLELPETPPPRPRPGTRRVGVPGRRLRRTAGPPPPESWMLGNYSLDISEESGLVETGAAGMGRVICRLDRLPGTMFPQRTTLVHMVLKSMALHWVWHLEYDGQFLALLPSHIKVLLLSYIGIHARDQPLRGMMHGLRPLFEKRRPYNRDSPLGDDMPQDSDLDIGRLDLCGAIGRWMTWKQLSGELFVSAKPKPVPSSWEDELDVDVDVDEDDGPVTVRSDTPLSKMPTQRLRFENLRYLSLAHPNPSATDWNSLINLLSRLSTLTHLSLAHWPVPTVTPNAINVRVRHPTQRSLTFAYGGTDAYAAIENNWAEAAGIMRRLSRATYCLKWLDLEGCGEWIPALGWDGVGPDGEAYVTGPEWNKSWRDIEFVRLGPGWLPHIDDSELPPPPPPTSSSGQATYATPSPVASSSSPRSLAFSVHAASANRDTDSDLPWDVEVERINYRREKELEQYREAVQSAKAVQQRILRTRKTGKGKWMHFSFGLEGLDEDVLRRLLGKEYLSLLP